MRRHGPRASCGRSRGKNDARALLRHFGSASKTLLSKFSSGTRSKTKTTEFRTGGLTLAARPDRLLICNDDFRSLHSTPGLYVGARFDSRRARDRVVPDAGGGAVPQ